MDTATKCRLALVHPRWKTALYVLLPVGFSVYLYLRGEDLLGTPFGVVMRVCWILAGIVAAAVLARACMYVELQQGAIRLKLLNLTIRCYPVSQPALFCVAQPTRRQRVIETVWIGICFFSCREAAAFREEQLQKKPLRREEIPFRKQKGGWQVVFAREYLIRRALRYYFVPAEPGILWVDWSQERQTELEALYPDVMWLNVTWNDLYT